MVVTSYKGLGIFRLIRASRVESTRNARSSRRDAAERGKTHAKTQRRKEIQSSAATVPLGPLGVAGQSDRTKRLVRLTYRRSRHRKHRLVPRRSVGRGQGDCDLRLVETGRSIRLFRLNEPKSSLAS